MVFENSAVENDIFVLVLRGLKLFYFNPQTINQSKENPAPRLGIEIKH